MTDLARTSVFGERFAYGGVSFEILADFDSCRPSGSLSRCLHDGPTYANVWCEVRRARVSHRPGPRSDERWDGHRMTFSSRGVAGELTHLGARYAATARLRSPENMSSLVEKIADAVRARSRALTFRGSAIAVNGSACLVLGDPALIDPALFREHGFAQDRIALAKLGEQWRAWRLAGDFEQPASLPLGSIAIVSEEQAAPVVAPRGSALSIESLARRVHEDHEGSHALLRELVAEVSLQRLGSASLSSLQ